MAVQLSVIVPIYNEEKTIRRILEKVLKQKVVGEVVVINDASFDNSGIILKKIRDKKVKIYNHQTNLGKGAAIRTGIDKASGKYIIIQDADLEYDPSDYSRLLEAASPNTAVYGSRLIDHNPMAYRRTYLGNVLLTGLCNFLFGTNLTDSYTCYKLLPLKIARTLNLQSKRFELEAEITAKLAKKGIKITEVPINYHPRTYQTGKKIKSKDAAIGALALLKVRIGLL